MKNFIEVHDKANELTLVNVNYITVINVDAEEGVIIHTSDGVETNTRENYSKVKSLIESTMNTDTL